MGTAELFSKVLDDYDMLVGVEISQQMIDFAFQIHENLRQNKDGKVKKLNALAKQVVKLPPFTTLKMCPDIKDNYVYDPAKGYYKQASEPLLQQKIYQLFECPFEGYISIMFLLRKFWVKCYLSKRSLEKKLLRTLGMSAFSL